MDAAVRVQAPLRSRRWWGIAIFEPDSAAQVVEGISPWLAFFDFDVTPVVPVEEAVPLFMKTNAWRQSVS